MTMTREAPVAHDKSEALAKRYGPASRPSAGPWNAVIASLLDHRSVRGYKPDPLPAGTLETLISAAQSAATSSNLQTWSVVAVNDPATRAEFARIANNQKHIEQCPLFLAFLADVSRLERLGAEENLTLENTPYLETFLVASIDAALAAQNAVVAAEITRSCDRLHRRHAQRHRARGGTARIAAGCDVRIRSMCRLSRRWRDQRGQGAPAAGCHPASRAL